MFCKIHLPDRGYDGWLYNCSQSSAPNFHGTALGDLSQAKFWDLYYDYDASDFKKYFEECSRKLDESGCRCDRKMHLANINLQNQVFSILVHSIFGIIGFGKIAKVHLEHFALGLRPHSILVRNSIASAEVSAYFRHYYDYLPSVTCDERKFLDPA